MFLFPFSDYGWTLNADEDDPIGVLRNYSPFADSREV